METFRRWTGNLDLITNLNNDVLKQLNPVELPLVKPYLEKFDKVSGCASVEVERERKEKDGPLVYEQRMEAQSSQPQIDHTLASQPLSLYCPYTKSSPPSVCVSVRSWSPVW